MEAYVAPGDRRERGRNRISGDPNRSFAKPYYHLVILARDAVGYRNLVKLSSLAYTEGFYAKPRVDRELLARHNQVGCCSTMFEATAPKPITTTATNASMRVRDCS